MIKFIIQKKFSFNRKKFYAKIRYENEFQIGGHCRRSRTEHIADSKIKDDSDFLQSLVQVGQRISVN